MIINKTTQIALETFLGMTFGSKVEHYQVVSKKGLDYLLINEIEVNYNNNIKKTYSPFSTFISKSILLKNIDGKNIIQEGLEEVKKLSIFSIFSKIANKREELKTILELSQKCISDELLKSKKLLESKEVDNPAVLLLLKGIKNLENPEEIKGLTSSAIQEVGALQIGMAINSLNSDIPKIFKYIKKDTNDFLYFMNIIKDNKFIKKCCENAMKQEKLIFELHLTLNKDKQFDSYISENNEINHFTSFSDLTTVEKNKKISQIKTETIKLLKNNRMK